MPCTVNVIKHLGDPDQLADQMLINAGEGTWTTNHRLRGRCYIAFRLFYQKDLFPSMPQISALVRGKLLLDPRTGLTKWSDNAALCIFDYLRGTDGWQMGIAPAEISSASFIAAANACGEQVQTAGVFGNIAILKKAATSKPQNIFQRTPGAPVTTVNHAHQQEDDDLKLDHLQRVRIFGNGLAAGLFPNRDYWVIRDADNSKHVEQLNVVNKPIFQFGNTKADAAALVPVPITTEGTGDIYNFEELFMTDLNLAGLCTGDQVQIWQLDLWTLLRSFTQGPMYYWISKGAEQVKNFAQGDAVSYGHGNLASSLANALAGIKIEITGLGTGQAWLLRQWELSFHV